MTQTARNLVFPGESRAAGLPGPERVQDPYSMRCAPQVHGPVRDALAYARTIIETEVNSATDNPLILSDGEGRRALSGGHFHGQYVAQAMDFLAIAIAVLLYFILAKTATGYEIRLTGANPVSARYAGVSFLKIALITMFIGGAIAGIAGVHQTAGIRGVFKIHRYFAVYPGTWAYYGIVFGLISVSNPLAAIFVTFFFSGMQVGTQALQSRLGLGFGADLAFIGILMILLVAGQYFYHKKIVWLKMGNRGRPKGKKT